MVIRVFSYLQKTKNYSLTYTGRGKGLEAYSDASLNDCKDALTTCGYAIRLYGDTIAWRTHKKTYVELSTCEAEYIAMTEACKELMSMYYSLKYMKLEIERPMLIWCDNVVAGYSAQIEGGTKLRHLGEKEFYYMKERVKSGWVKVIWVEFKEQKADIFTKPLPFVSHNKLTNELLNLNFSLTDSTSAAGNN